MTILLRISLLYLLFILFVMAKNILVDIDGTVCEDVDNEFSNRFSTARVLPGAVESINRFANEGHSVTFFTARTSEHKEDTIKWLDAHGFVYKDIIFNKPRSKGYPGGYVWIDNINVAAITFKTWLSDQSGYSDLDECEN
jgi:hypothetical protein